MIGQICLIWGAFDWEIRISDFPKNAKSKNGFPITEILLRDGFPWTMEIRNPDLDFEIRDFKIKIQISQSNAPLVWLLR